MFRNKRKKGGCRGEKEDIKIIHMCYMCATSHHEFNQVLKTCASKNQNCLKKQTERKYAKVLTVAIPD